MGLKEQLHSNTNVYCWWSTWYLQLQQLLDRWGRTSASLSGSVPHHPSVIPNCTKSGSTSSFENDADDDNVYLESNSNSTSKHPQMDPYFVLSSASFSFVVIFGFCTLVIVATQHLLNFIAQENRFKFITKKDDLFFPQWQLMLIGFFDAMNGIFVVFASPPNKTAPFLQAILGNCMIPLTILFR